MEQAIDFCLPCIFIVETDDWALESFFPLF